jgi:hypothetical protein
MKRSHSSALLSKLKSSLPKPLPDPLISPEGTPASLPSGRAPKLSVSLYHTDLKRLDEIKDFMRSRGHRNLSDSEALRLACRAVVITDGFMEVYKEMLAEDGRRRRADQ